jgi:hypothetical protein
MQVQTPGFDWRRSYGLDIAAVGLLLWASYLLAHTSGYHRYSYYETLRNVVCAAWVLAAFRFAAFRWIPVVVFCGLVAWLFNPIFPVTMRKWQWQPYDHWTMILCLVAAAILSVLSMRAHAPTG